MNMVGQDTLRERCQNLGEACISTAAAGIRKSAEFGTTPDTKSITMACNTKEPNALSYLSFDPDDAVLKTFPHPEKMVSINNLKSDAAVVGSDGNPVAPQTALLVGVGRMRQDTYLTYIRIARQPFPHAIATNGAFKSTGGLLVGLCVR